jgi:hypothetical protein
MKFIGYFKIDYVCGAMVTVKCAWFFSASDWRYAAEQFVKRLPDKVIVHRKHSHFLINIAATFPHFLCISVLLIV